ncbi:hypothetical protein PV433_00720 [Paenibacillus sp. GYB004]|uniref:hypothetical protein n=1 Tax=Paenibacillus sp. GYB004 TaxID=2994393 RepID=UPI002F96669D
MDGTYRQTVDGGIDVPPILHEAARQDGLALQAYRMLLRWIPFADSHYTEWDRMPNCGYFFGGSYWYGLDTARTITVYAVLSVIGPFDEKAAGCTRERLMERAIAGIRYLAFTHDAGPPELVRVKGTNPFCSEKKWGGRDDSYFMATQTGYSVSSLAMASWVLWDRLDEETRTLVGKVVEHYADRWCDIEPRDGVYYDTQVEENSWVAQGIAAAADLFPGHPRNAHWRSRFRKWAANSLTTFRDRFNLDYHQHNDRSKGIPLSFINTSTLHPDYTTENHGFVHPTYLVLGINQRATHALFALMSGRQADPFALMNNEPLYDRTIKMCCQADGFMIPVQGQDWWYNRQHELLLTHAVLNVIHGNPDAARLERHALDRLEQIQTSNANGCFLEENGEACVIREGYQTARDFENWAAQDVLYVYLLHAFGGAGAAPSDRDEMGQRLSGVFSYPYGGFVVHRSGDQSTFSSFSWRNDVMGVTLGEPGIWLTVPSHASMTGVIRLDGHTGAPGLTNEEIVRDAGHVCLDTRREGFGVTALIRRGGGELEQDVAFVSLPDGRTVYAERQRAVQDCSIRDNLTGLVGVRNETYQAVPESADGRRTVHLPAESVTFAGFCGDADDEERSFADVAYVNLDGKIGYVLYGSNGIKYVNKHRYPRWKGVENTLILNDSGARELKAGEALPVFAVITLPNRNNEQTAEEASKSAMLSAPDSSYVIIECGGEAVAYANFGFERVVVTGRKELAGEKEIPLYEGTNRVSDGRAEWVMPVEARKAGYAAAVLRMSWETADEADGTPDAPDARKCSLDAIVSEDGVYVLNKGEHPVTVRLAGAKPDTNRTLELAAGSFAELKLS